MWPRPLPTGPGITIDRKQPSARPNITIEKRWTDGLAIRGRIDGSFDRTYRRRPSDHRLAPIWMIAGRQHRYVDAECLAMAVAPGLDTADTVAPGNQQEAKQQFKQ
jgi:hypothetical protein